MIADYISLITYLMLIFTYGLYIQKAVCYFKKSSIENMVAYRTIQIVGILLILMLLGGGFGKENHLLVSLASMVLFLLSVGFITEATSQHQVDRLDFAFSKEENRFLTTQGAYTYIRHPIYAAYTAGWLGGLLFTQLYSSIPLIFILIGLYVFAIKKEEAGFLNSEYAKEYRDYMSRTCRMFPLIY